MLCPESRTHRDFYICLGVFSDRPAIPDKRPHVNLTRDHQAAQNEVYWAGITCGDK